MKKFLDKLMFDLIGCVITPIWVLLPILLTLLQGWASFVFQYPDQCDVWWKIVAITLLLIVVILGVCITTPFGLFVIAPFLLFSLLNLIISVYSVFWNVDFNSEYFFGLNYLFGDHTSKIFEYNGLFICTPIVLFILYGLISIVCDSKDPDEERRIRRWKSKNGFRDKDNDYRNNCYYCHNFERSKHFVCIPMTNIKLYQMDKEKCKLGEFECSYQSYCWEFDCIDGLRPGDRKSIDINND